MRLGLMSRQAYKPFSVSAYVRCTSGRDWCFTTKPVTRLLADDMVRVGGEGMVAQACDDVRRVVMAMAMCGITPEVGARMLRGRQWKMTISLEPVRFEAMAKAPDEVIVRGPAWPRLWRDRNGRFVRGKPPRPIATADHCWYAHPRKRMWVEAPPWGRPVWGCPCPACQVAGRRVRPMDLLRAAEDIRGERVEFRDREGEVQLRLPKRRWMAVRSGTPITIPVGGMERAAGHGICYCEECVGATAVIYAVAHYRSSLRHSRRPVVSRDAALAVLLAGRAQWEVRGEPSLPHLRVGLGPWEPDESIPIPLVRNGVMVGYARQHYDGCLCSSCALVRRYRDAVASYRDRRSAQIVRIRNERQKARSARKIAQMTSGDATSSEWTWCATTSTGAARWQTRTSCTSSS